MTSSAVIALDVGGTQIKAGAVVDGEVVAASVGHYESGAGLAAKETIGHFAAVVADVLRKSGTDACVDGLGLAFPGPFDYEAGVSRIRGLGKFDALYGLPVGSLLDEALRADERTGSRLAPHFRLAFENDAALFGLGETGPGGAAEGAGRVVCLTIGTGLGSCFLDSGRLVKTRADVPSDGWLYATPYKNRMADDYISRRGVLQLAARFGLADAGLDVKDLALLADGGDAAAQRLFCRFGERMAEILAPPLLRFGPESIVLGGQISRSAHLFLPAFRQALAGSGMHAEVRVGRDTLASTLLGIYRFMTETTFLTGGER